MTARTEGFAIAPNWMVRDPSIPARAKVVFLVLSSHTGRDGAWYMGHRQIAEEAGCSVPTVIRALNELRDLGLVTWDKRTANGGLLENVYRVHLTPPSDHQRQDPPVTHDTTLLSPVTEQKEEPQEEPQEEPTPLLPRPAAGKPDADAEFETWYETYPRKEAKADARKAWPKARKTMTLQALLDAVAAKRGGLHRERQFMPNPASWLNGRRWEDEPVGKSLSEMDRSAWSEEWANGTALADWESVAGDRLTR